MRSVFSPKYSHDLTVRQTFNEELEAMYVDSTLRLDQALVAMAGDLRKSKAKRNELDKENAYVQLHSMT